MNIFKKLVDYCNQRVSKFGAQYKTFSIFGIINYPLVYVLVYLLGSQEKESFVLRFIATFLCLGLLLKDKWPERFKTYLPLYWYFTLMFSLPFLTSYMLFLNNFSLNWLMNYTVGLMILILLIDWLMCIVLLFMGFSIGSIVFLLTNHNHDFSISSNNLSLFAYMFLSVLVMCGIFLRNKEVHEGQLHQIKDDVNAMLEQKIKERTMQLEQKAEELNIALDARNRFLNNLSHEVRTPIHGVLGISDGLYEMWFELEEPKKYELIKNIVANAKRLCNLVNNILDLSRFNLGKVVLEYDKTDLIFLIKDIHEECNELYLLSNPNNAILKFTFPENLKNAYIAGDHSKITQVLRNLLSNAIRYSVRGAKRNLIETSIAKIIITYNDDSTKEGYLVVIKDEGIGLPEKEVEHIFEPFYETSRTTSMSGGTGLGLAIVEDIVTAHHGIVWAENNPDTIGAKFSFILPVLQTKKEDKRRIVKHEII